VSKAVRYPRRAIVVASCTLLLSGCASVSSLLSKPVAESDPRKTIDDYFALLSQDRYAEAKSLLTFGYQSRLGSASLSAVLHSIRSATVSDAVDAIAWANGLGARLPAPPADRREFLVTLQIQPTTSGQADWSAGLNRRFVGLLRGGPGWQIDYIDSSPGLLVTGQPATPADNSVHAAVIPVASLHLGPAPIDRVIFAARQSAADRGGIPWATDPVQEALHDGPSFGWNSSDAARLVSRDQDPTTLLPRAVVEVRHGSQVIQVTLVQPIRSGKGGVWAIARVELAPPSTQ